MIDQKFTHDEYLRRMIGYTVRMDDHSKSAFELNGNYYGRYRLTDVFIPLEMETCKSLCRELSYYGPLMLYWAYKNAEFFRWSLVDESIPLHDRDGALSLKGQKTVYCIYDGCRQSNAIALLELRYWPALPELREAMLHERDSYMRALCVETIGVMGERGLVYAKDIRESIRKFNDDQYFIGEAVKALGILGDKDGVALLLELYEETRARIDRLTFDEAMDKERWSIYLIGDIAEALIKLDPQTAHDILAMELANPNTHVHHFTKRAFQLSPLRHDAKLIGSSLTATVASLPKDPQWIFRRYSGL